jgi:tRNA pseudouridine38-40 synthase
VTKIKTRVAMITGYNGIEFCGSLKNPDVRTVEAVLEDTLYANKLISKDNYGVLAKISFSRASRTDKRVHAL